MLWRVDYLWTHSTRKGTPLHYCNGTAHLVQIPFWIVIIHAVEFSPDHYGVKTASCSSSGHGYLSYEDSGFGCS